MLFRSKGLGNQIDKQHLGFEARVWLRFINNCVMPTMSFTNVGPDRIALLYCFMTQQPVDIASIICSSMAQFISNRSNKTYFGSIIHALCRRKKIASLPDDEEGKIARPINSRTLATIIDPSDVQYVQRESKRRRTVIAALQSGSIPVGGAPKILSIDAPADDDIPPKKKRRQTSQKSLNQHWREGPSMYMRGRKMLKSLKLLL